MTSKRVFDLSMAILAILFLAVPLLLIGIISFYDTKSSGIFIQTRIGCLGESFQLIKFRTINPKTGTISKVGRFLRSTKIDELPQLINIVKGDMSFVGPRPDLPGYYDKLTGPERAVLMLKPGLTSEASIKYRNEIELLSGQKNPEKFNDEVIFPDKVRMNLEYVKHATLTYDLLVILATIFPYLRKFLKTKV